MNNDKQTNYQTYSLQLPILTLTGRGIRLITVLINLILLLIYVGLITFIWLVFFSPIDLIRPAFF